MGVTAKPGEPGHGWVCTGEEQAVPAGFGLC